MTTNELDQAIATGTVAVIVKLMDSSESTSVATVIGYDYHAGDKALTVQLARTGSIVAIPARKVVAAI